MIFPFHSFHGGTTDTKKGDNQTRKEKKEKKKKEKKEEKNELKRLILFQKKETHKECCHILATGQLRPDTVVPTIILSFHFFGVFEVFSLLVSSLLKTVDKR